MSNDNQFTKQIQETQKQIQENIEKHQKNWLKEQEKAKKILDDLKNEGLKNFEHVKEHIQKHTEHLQDLGKDLHDQVKNKSFDFHSFSKSISDYQSKQLELVLDMTQKHTKRLSDLQNKVISFYHEKTEQKHQAPEQHENVKQQDTPTVKKSPVKRVVRKTTKVTK